MLYCCGILQSSNNVWGNCFHSLIRASVSDSDWLFHVILSLLLYFSLPWQPLHSRRKSPSPSSPRRRKSRSPSERRNKRKRSRSVTSSPIAKSTPQLRSPENKNVIDKQRLEEEKKRWGVSALLFRVWICNLPTKLFTVSLFALPLFNVDELLLKDIFIVILYCIHLAAVFTTLWGQVLLGYLCSKLYLFQNTCILIALDFSKYTFTVGLVIFLSNNNIWTIMLI
jgi:arginine/glutamate-rich protein 1